MFPNFCLVWPCVSYILVSYLKKTKNNPLYKGLSLFSFHKVMEGSPSAMLIFKGPSFTEIDKFTMLKISIIPISNKISNYYKNP